MEVIERQQPKIIHMAPVCGSWSQMQNINDPADTYQKRKKYLPMVEFCARGGRRVGGVGNFCPTQAHAACDTLLMLCSELFPDTF